jgi:hypothetical protein
MIKIHVILEVYYFINLIVDILCDSQNNLFTHSTTNPRDYQIILKRMYGNSQKIISVGVSLDMRVLVNVDLPRRRAVAYTKSTFWAKTPYGRCSHSGETVAMNETKFEFP